MPRLINIETGALEYLSGAKAGAALGKTHKYPDEINTVDSAGVEQTIPGSQVDLAAGLGQRPATVEEEASADLKRAFGDSPIQTALESAADTYTFGLSNKVLASAQGGTRGLKARRENHPIASGVGVGVGVLAPGGAPSLIMKGGKLVKAAAGGKALGAVLGGMAEGGAFGLGHELSQAGLDDRPVSIDKALASMGSGALIGGAIGGGGWALGKAAQVAKARGAQMLSKAGGVATEEGTALATEMAAIRNEVKEVIPFLKQLNVSGETKQIGRKAARELGNTIDKPELLANKPWRGLGPMETQRTYLKKIQTEIPRLRQELIAEGREGGSRWKALDVVESVLPRNQALSDKVYAFEKAAQQTGKGLGDQLVQGAAFVIGTKLASPLGPLAPIVGGALSKAIANRGSLEGLTGKLARGVAGVSKKMEGGIAAFFEGAGKTAKVGAVKAGIKETLEGTSFGPTPQPRPFERPVKPTKDERVKVYRERAKEIQDNVTVDLTSGKQVVSQRAKERIYNNLAGVSAISPILASKMEKGIHRRIEFLAEKLPKRPQSASRIGPDDWKPSDFELHSFTRYVQAVEDPTSVIHRMVKGTLTPEDVEAFQRVYPDMYKEVYDRVTGNLHTLREKLPYEKLLSLSIFLQAPVDPSFEPNVIEVLQGNFDEEPGTEGGATPPKADFKNGSIAAPEPTTAQKSAGGM